MLVLVGFVLSFGLKHYWREPYPGLFQPAFAGKAARGGVEVVQEPTITVSFSDGGTAGMSHREVMAQSKAQQWSIFRSAFGVDSPRRTHPQTISWLQQRLSDLAEGREPERVVIDWREVTYDLAEERPPRWVSTDRTVIGFGGQGG